MTTRELLKPRILQAIRGAKQGRTIRDLMMSLCVKEHITTMTLAEMLRDGQAEVVGVVTDGSLRKHYVLPEYADALRAAARAERAAVKAKARDLTIEWINEKRRAERLGDDELEQDDHPFKHRIVPAIQAAPLGKVGISSVWELAQ